MDLILWILLCSAGGGAKAISLGVSESSPWDLEMAQRGYKVIEYDGSIEQCPYNHPNITFHKVFVGVGKDCISLDSIIKNNHLKKVANVLQVDIENAEWEVLEQMDIGLLAEYFMQVIFEFHGCNPEEDEGVKRRLAVLKQINEYYEPLHLHLNNHGKIFYSQGLFFSTTLEVSYIKKGVIPFSKEKVVEGILEGLDYPNHPSNPEIPIYFKG
ncbi:MAG: FkbM family methyltransferase [Helicobacter sp.]|nr:FkbM family methyltransferase [Helicobacter sp.]